MVVSLRPITDQNREAVLALESAAGQERVVSMVAESMQEAIDDRPTARSNRHEARLELRLAPLEP